MSNKSYCFTIEHDKEYKPTDIDIEYCEQVEEMGEDSAIIQFKRLPAVPKALCMKHVGPYERFYESYTEAFRYIDEQGYKVVIMFLVIGVNGLLECRKYVPLHSILEGLQPCVKLGL